MKRECETHGCTNMQHAKGLCRACYGYAWRNNGKSRDEVPRDSDILELERLETAYEHAVGAEALLRIKELMRRVKEALRRRFDNI